MHTLRLLDLFSVLCLAAVVGGCGPNQQTYGDAEVVEVTKADQLRSWLQGVVDAGALDSGVETLDDDVAALASENVENLDAIKESAAKLKSANTPATVREHAKAMLDLLPKTTE